ncbi:EAL domain-containing protein [Vibrio sinensis]|uniref:EAL domain-containing protein n=1 Tax=Vibrio sinensis TaxID=2302434 RepID=A0A3A6QR06_9VIBR|nr:EAL domain-containing protein [Vibrio sinensis]RJX70966.1 EAL domain-containing protein [Vibrio sinensis]
MKSLEPKINRLNSTTKEMFTHLPNLVPVVIIFLLVFCLSALLNFYHTQIAVKKDGNASIAELENYIESIAYELHELSPYISYHCNDSDKLGLRSYVFNSDMLKEAGVYYQGVVTCTSNEGKANIPLYPPLLSRLANTSNKVTISLSQSKSGFTAFFIYASTGERSGLNALLPPSDFLETVIPKLQERRYGYSFKVLSEHIYSDNIYNGNNRLKEPKSILYFSSQRYPLSLTLYINNESYLFYFVQHIWQTILIACVLSVFYLLIRYQMLAKRSIEFSLINAIKHDRIEMYLQPIVDITTERVVGSEALLRWNHPSQGQISPDIFIPLAEKLGVIGDVTKQTFSTLTQFLHANPTYTENHYISVNLSRNSIIDASFIRYLYDYADSHPDIVGSILLEVTENIDFSQVELDSALDNLKLLKQLGFQIAIDDFGTGYSGLNFIRLHSFHVMKIDRVFIKSLHSESTITPVLVSMIHLANELKMKVIAEGVETPQQIAQLRKLGVRYIQGFYYSHPIKPDAFLAYSGQTKKEKSSKCLST